MPRARYTIIRVPADTLEDAHELVGRMTAIGVPRDHMNVTPHADDSYHVAIHVREDERAWIETALAAGQPASVLATPRTAALLIAGGAAALGAGLWALWSYGPQLRSRIAPLASRLGEALPGGAEPDREDGADSQEDEPSRRGPGPGLHAGGP